MIHKVQFVGWLVVFYVPSTAMLFRDAAPLTVPYEGCEAPYSINHTLVNFVYGYFI